MSALLISAVFLLLLCLLGWWRQTITKNAGYADLIWSLGVGISALFYLSLGSGDIGHRLLAALLIGVWSVRLGGHIWRRLYGAEEEGRYRAMRDYFGAKINVFHFFFFFSQGLLAWLFALPHWFLSGHPGGSTAWLWLGFSIGMVALLGEAIADHQLDKFRRQAANQGITCRQGLWRYSRHPNYFFEWLHWFSYPLMAIGMAGAGWLWLAPVVMFLFLWFVTGIPYTELQALKSRGEDYRDYQRSTSVFIPWRTKS